MKRIDDYKGFLSTASDHLDKLLVEWKATSYDVAEKIHEDNLEAWLQKRLPDVPIITQYGIAKGKADIVIEDTHVIELKLGFGGSNVAEFDRCIGQMERYRQKWVNKDRGHVYLVIVGDSDSEFRDLLHTWFKEANAKFQSDRLLADEAFHLIEKRPGLS